MINVIYAKTAKDFDSGLILTSRVNNEDIDVTNSVKKIIDDVKTHGIEAVKKYSLRFDYVQKITHYYPDDFKRCYDEIDEDFRKTLNSSAQNIRAFHLLQKRNPEISLNHKDFEIGEMTVALDRVAVYVPGGTASYPSSVLMCVIPAKIAGVKHVTIFTPPYSNSECNKDLLAAAHVAHADEMILVGGAHGIALAAYGADDILPVDKIVGPGNIYVATAKKLLYGVCDIDMIAGPSEIVIVADDTANPSFIAADMISQAEHDVRASAILITTSKLICGATIKELEKQISKLPRKKIIKDSITYNSHIIVCNSLESAFEIANKIAPEHLEIQTKNAKEDMKLIHNAGSVFLGNYTPEPVGDYYAGLNHVLPTGGSARFFSPLSVNSFTKTIQYAYYTKEKLNNSADNIIRFAEREGFTGHANSVRKRLEDFTTQFDFGIYDDDLE